MSYLIRVNGVDTYTESATLSYDDACELAALRGRAVAVTVRAPGYHRIMIAGEEVEVEDGLVINAYVTDNA